MDIHDYVNPWDELYGEFESASPFEEDVKLERRRRIIAMNMYLNPDTTTWFGLRKQYSLLAHHRRQKERRKALEQRILALGLDPEGERDPDTRRLRALALEFGLNPYTATWEDVESAELELHKVVLPKKLAWRARYHLLGKSMHFEDLIRRALEYYLDSYEKEANKAYREREEFYRVRGGFWGYKKRLDRQELLMLFGGFLCCLLLFAFAFSHQ